MKVNQFIWSLIYSTSAKTVQHITFGGLVGRNESAVSNCEITSAISSDITVDADLKWMKGNAYAYTYLYAGAFVGYNSGNIQNSTVKRMSYNVQSGDLQDKVLAAWRGKIYDRESGFYNYSQIEGIMGVVGSSDKNGVAKDIIVN